MFSILSAFHYARRSFRSYFGEGVGRPSHLMNALLAYAFSCIGCHLACSFSGISQQWLCLRVWCSRSARPASYCLGSYNFNGSSPNAPYHQRQSDPFMLWWRLFGKGQVQTLNKAPTDLLSFQSCQSPKTLYNLSSHFTCRAWFANALSAGDVYPFPSLLAPMWLYTALWFAQIRAALSCIPVHYFQSPARS